MASAIYFHLVVNFVHSLGAVKNHCGYVGAANVNCEVQDLNHGFEQLNQKLLNVFLMPLELGELFPYFVAQSLEHIGESGGHSMDEILVESGGLYCELLLKCCESRSKEFQQVIIEVELLEFMLSFDPSQLI